MCAASEPPSALAPAPGGGSFASGRSQSICVTYNKSVMCPYGTDDEMHSTEQSVGPQDEEVPKVCPGPGPPPPTQ